MESWKRWLYAIGGLAAAFVATASVAQAIRQGSWGPIVSAGWIPAVVVAAWPGSHRRCRGLGPRRGTPAE
jgi:hypothetical protein